MGEKKVTFTRSIFSGGGTADFVGMKCIGTISFVHVRFLAEGLIDFGKAEFLGPSNFSHVIFRGEAHFVDCTFETSAYFRFVTFEKPHRIMFQTTDLSMVSFIGTDITRILFAENTRFGTWSPFVTSDERKLEQIIKNKDGTKAEVSLGSIKAVYRALRENYEYRMRYDEAGQFFVSEMELKRKYREAPSISLMKLKFKILVRLKWNKSSLPNITYGLKKNNWLRRQFSLTGWYYHLSRYGEDLLRPTLAGIVIVLLSTLFWLTQSRPTLAPALNITNVPPYIANHTSTFVLLNNATNPEHLLKAFERSIADFIPLLPLGANIELGVIDYIIKIVGGTVTFALLAVGLRRRFERRFRH